MGISRSRGTLKTCIVYALLDPLTREVRYIGKSVNGLSRPKAHMEPARLARTHTYSACWIKSLAKANLRPEILILSEHTSAGEVYLAEQDYIALYRHLGARLTNLSDGGPGPVGMRQSPESIEKRACQLRGRKRPAEVVARVAAANPGYERTPEIREKIRQARLMAGGQRLQAINRITGEIREFSSIRQARLAGHGYGAISASLRGISFGKYESRRKWDWSRI